MLPNNQLLVLLILPSLVVVGSAQAKALPTTNLSASPVNPVDVSKPTTVVGSGTPSSCTEDAFTNAIAKGGIITFNCGSSPYTLVVSAEKTIPNDTVIDGGNLVTLSGGDKTRLLSIKSSYDKSTPSLTVQNITLTRGHTTDVANTTSTTSGGAAIYRLGGTLTVINSQFTNNVGPVTGQDVAGGAIYSVGGGTTTIVGSVLKNNQASNGGAIGSLGSALTVINTEVSNNVATGNGGNPGNGGNGGGISIDGENNSFGVAVNLSNVKVINNKGNAYAGGVFRIAYHGETTMVDKSSFDQNSIPNQSVSLAGGLYLQGTNITMSNSSVSKNTANGAGGMYVGPSSVLNLTNVTVAQNTAATGLGGGLFIDNNVSGKILNSTIASNQTPGPYSFGGAIAGGSGNLLLGNTIIANNTVGNGYNPISCTQKLGNLGGNLQWPVIRQGGGSDDPSSLCSDGVIEADPLLGPLQDNGGPTLTLAPAASSPVVAQGKNNCPTTDQRGLTRQTPCTLGAYELSSSNNQASPLNRSGWSVTASSNTDQAASAIDGNADSRWTTGAAQTNGQYFQIDLGSTQTFSKIVLDATKSPNDYPRGYAVYVSNDGQNWGSAIASGSGSSAVTTINFPTQSARIIKIIQTGSDSSWWWSIHEVNVFN